MKYSAGYYVQAHRNSYLGDESIYADQIRNLKLAISLVDLAGLVTSLAPSHRPLDRVKHNIRTS